MSSKQNKRSSAVSTPATEEESNSRSSDPRKQSSRREKKFGKAASASLPTSSSADRGLTFLFVVTELVTTHIFTDSWGQPGPPDTCHAYLTKQEQSSGVMRYDNGIVEEAAEQYVWRRDKNSRVGSIYHAVDHEPRVAVTYSQGAVFSCNPLMPFAMVKTDPSVYETYYHGDLSSQTEDHKWQPLRFFAPLGADRRPTGVSQAVFSSSLTAAHIGGVPRPFVAGRHASWLGRLVPTTYDNPRSSAPRSAGLGGELTILLALMTFTAPVEACTSRAYTVFLGHNPRWRYGKWLHKDKPGGWTRSVEERPRGVLVTVSLDPWNPQGSTREKLSNLEFFGSPVIRED